MILVPALRQVAVPSFASEEGSVPPEEDACSAAASASPVERSRERVDTSQRWAMEIERLMASSRVCMKPGCRRRVVWRAGHDAQRHLAGACYV